MTGTSSSTPLATGQRSLALALVLVAVGNLVAPAGLGLYLPVALGMCAFHLLLGVRRLSLHTAAVMLILFFGATLVPGMLVGTETLYSVEKRQGVLIAVLLLLCPLVFRNARGGTRVSLQIAVILSLTTSIAVLLLGQAGVDGRQTIFDLNPIGVARMTGLSLAVLPVVLIRRAGRLSVGTGTVLAGCSAIALWATLATGSRGPLVAALVAVAATAVLLASRGLMRVGPVVALVVSSGAVVAAMVGTQAQGLTRILEGDDSGRLWLLRQSIDVARENPLGIGWGNLAFYVPPMGQTASTRYYSHNVFVELLVEGGLLALLGFVVTVSYAFSRAVRAATRRADVATSLVLPLLIYAFVNAQLSSDLVGNRMLWFAMGAAMLSPHRPDRTEDRSPPAGSLHRHGLSTRRPAPTP